MAEELKTVEVPKVDETTSAETAVAEPVVATEETPAAAAEPVVASTETPAETAAAPVEEARKEVVPVEDGQLEHKGSNFPKNFLYSKKYFWFGNDALDPKSAPSLLKDHHLASWASETGKGLLFYSEKGTDKATPSGAVHLADAAEPVSEGTNKFVLSSKGHKHTFKAGSPAERDNWVSQIKLKIAEAKELSTTVTESETYKKTLESFKPTPIAKKEEAKKEETPKAVEETPATETAAVTETPATTEDPVVADATETAATPESPKEVAKEEAKPRSASKKRGSIFGNLLGGKKDEKKEEKKVEEPIVESSETPVATAETPVEAATETPAVATTEGETAAATEVPATEEVKAERPTQNKRTSIFGGLSFGQSFNKKKTSSEDAAPAVPAKEPEAVSENAPVIPAPEVSEPLSTDVSSPATVPVETTDITPATNGETKKEVKSDKRKSSLPFAFGKKKEGTAAATEEGAETEKVKSPNAFSKFRATIKGKGKGAEKSEEKAAETDAPKIEEEAAPAESSEAPTAATEEATTEEAAKDAPIASTPTVAATA